MKYLKKKEGPLGLDICKGEKMANKDDLLNIGNGDNNQNNMKKILIYVAVAFLIFVIGVIGFAILQNNKNSEKDTIIPPETKVQPKQENLFKQIPIENDNTQPQTKPSQTKQPQTTPQPNIKENVIQNSTKKQPQPQNIEQNKPQNEPEAKEVKTKEPVVQPKKSNQEKITIPGLTENTKSKITKNRKNSTSKKINKGKYYIQVAALLRHKKPSRSFLKLITKNGYKYRFFVTYTKIKNEKVKVTKVLVGPFSNEKYARKALKKVKANITQNAFIFKVK